MTLLLSVYLWIMQLKNTPRDCSIFRSIWHHHRQAAHRFSFSVSFYYFPQGIDADQHWWVTTLYIHITVYTTRIYYLTLFLSLNGDTSRQKCPTNVAMFLFFFFIFTPRGANEEKLPGMWMDMFTSLLRICICLLKGGRRGRVLRQKNKIDR